MMRRSIVMASATSTVSCRSVVSSDTSSVPATGVLLGVPGRVLLAEGASCREKKGGSQLMEGEERGGERGRTRLRSPSRPDKLALDGLDGRT